MYYVYGAIKKLGLAKDFSEKEDGFAIFFILFKIYGSLILNIVKLLKKRCKIRRNKKMRYEKIHRLQASFKINAKELTLKGRIFD